MVSDDAQELLELALQEGNARWLEQALADGADPNALMWSGQNPPLYWVTQSGRVDLVKLLLASGAKAATELGTDTSSLHLAAEDGNAEIVRLLLDADGASVLEHFDYIDRTPLMCAVQKGRLEVARMLIDAGSDVNSNNEPRIGNTALHIAVRESTPEMVALLLGAGADPTIQGWMWNTPADYAQRRFDRCGAEIREMLAHPERWRKRATVSNRKQRRMNAREPREC